MTVINASVVVYNHTVEEINPLIAKIKNSDFTKIFIIDNSSNNDLEASLLDVPLNIHYFFGHGNIGYGAGHNIAIRKSIEEGADYHLVINPDIHFETGTIEQLARFMEGNPQAGAVMPKVYYPDGQLQYLCKLLPTPMDLFVRRFLPFPNLKQRLNERYELRHSGYDKIMNLPCLSGCFMFLRVSALQEVGIFDEDYFMYGEDFDLYRRIHRKFETLFYPDVSIVHEHQKESYKSRKQLKVHIRSMIHYFNKWGWFFDSERRKMNSRILREIENMTRG